jgi:hypothetical protein
MKQAAEKVGFALKGRGPSTSLRAGFSTARIPELKYFTAHPEAVPFQSVSDFRIFPQPVEGRALPAL